MEIPAAKIIGFRLIGHLSQASRIQQWQRILAQLVPFFTTLFRRLSATHIAVPCSGIDYYANALWDSLHCHAMGWLESLG